MYIERWLMGTRAATTHQVFIAGDQVFPPGPGRQHCD